MTRDELLERIQEAIRTEESATQVCLCHLDAVMDRTSLSPAAHDEVCQIINTLIAANEGHKQRLSQVATQIEEESDDVY